MGKSRRPTAKSERQHADKIPAPKLKLDERGLLETYPNRKWLYGRWDVGFGAWCHDGHGWFEQLPQFNLLEGDGDAVSFEEDIEQDLMVSEDDLTWDWLSLMDGVGSDLRSMHHCWQWKRLRESYRSKTVVDDYVALIPRDLRRVVATLGPFQWVALEGAWHDEKFAGYLIEAVSQYGPQYIRLCWSLTQPHAQSQSWRLHFCRQLVTRTPRDVLSWIIGKPLAVGAIKIIQRLEGLPRQRPDLRALCRVLTVPWKVEKLSNLSRISGDSAANLDVLPRWLWHPKILRLLSEDCPFLKLLPEYLSEVGAKVKKPGHQAGFARYLEASKDANTMTDRLVRELTEFRWDSENQYMTPRKRLATPFPEPPAAGDHLLWPLCNLKALRREGRAMKNCLGDYALRVQSGENYAYSWIGEERASVLIERDGESPWFVADCAGIANTSVSAATKAKVTALLAQQLGDAFQESEDD